MAGVRKQDAIQPGAYPILRLSSILATVFLVVITIGSLTVKSFQPEQAIVMQSEYQAEAPALLLGAGAGSDVPVQEAEPISPEQTIAAKRGLEGSSQETFSIAATPISPPDEKPTAEIMTAMEAPEERTIKDNSLDLEAPQVSSAQRSEASARRLSVRNLLTVFQIALALIALLTGAIALYLRRRPYL